MSNRIKVWKYGDSELVEMCELKKNDVFHMDRANSSGDFTRDDLMVACKDAITLDPEKCEGATCEVTATRFIPDPNWGNKK